jgi:hypothetical protein
VSNPGLSVVCYEYGFPQTEMCNALDDDCDDVVDEDCFERAR